MTRSTIYADYNATAPLHPTVQHTLQEALTLYGNASSIHEKGRAVRARIEAARAQIAAWVGASPERVVFTSGATEANNMALQGFKGPVIVSAGEHVSVRDVRTDAHICPLHPSGVVDLDALEAILKNTPEQPLVAIMAANSETGVIQPLQDIAQLCRRYRALWLCDAVQIAGKAPETWAQLKQVRPDFISLSAHKVGGPSGIGALIIPDGPPKIASLMKGGGQERYNRPGTENVLGILGFDAAIKSLSTKEWVSTQVHRNQLEKKIQDLCATAAIIPATTMRLHNTTILHMPGVPNMTQIMHFDLDGIYVSAGSACSSGKVHTSHVLRAMGYPDTVAKESIRISLGPQTTEHDIERIFTSWSRLFHKTRSKMTTEHTTLERQTA